MEKALSSSPTWFYIDSLGYERGPLRPDEMLWRYNAGYFPAHLMVRRTNQSTFTKIKALALCEVVQSMVNYDSPAVQQYVTRRGDVEDGNPFEKIKGEVTIGTSGEKDTGIKEEKIRSFPKPKQEFKEERSGKIEVKKEDIETEIKDEYIKSEVQDQHTKSECRKEYIKTEMKRECIKPDVQDEYMESVKQEVKDKYIKTEVKDEYIEPEVKNEYMKPDVPDQRIKTEVNKQCIKLEVKDKYIKPEVKDEYIEPEIKNEHIKMEFKSEYIKSEIKRESSQLAINKQIVILKNKYGVKKGDTYTIKKLSNSGKSWWINNEIGKKLVPVNARGSLYDIFIQTGNEETKPEVQTKMGSMKQPTENNEKNKRKSKKSKKRIHRKERKEKKARRKKENLDEIKKKVGDGTIVVMAARNDNGKKLENVSVSRDGGNDEMLEKALETSDDSLQN